MSDSQPPITQREARTASGSMPAIMTEQRFREILREVVGDKLLEIHETLKRLAPMVDDHEGRIRDLERRVARLEAVASASGGTAP